MSDKNTIFIDRMSVHCTRSLSDLVNEACSSQIPFFDTGVGFYTKQWKKVKQGYHLVYSIDNVGVCGGEIRYIKTKAFRPRWIPDFSNYTTFVGFARSMCCESYNDDWKEEMIQVGIDAVDKKLWWFATFVIMSPEYFYHSNINILNKKIEEMNTAEKEMKEMISLG